MEKINVTKPFLPPLETYIDHISGVWQRSSLTNNGPLVVDLEEQLKNYLQVPHLHLVTNGTVALQLALYCLGIREGEIITTPFSYVATISSILWERCTPVFVDIEPKRFSIDYEQIESRITPQTKAILAVHVFGYPCEVEQLEKIATKHDLKLIYDGAHAFGCVYKGKSLLNYGDASTCSFHATKLFHMGEGGAVIVHDQTIANKLNLSRSFGHINDDHLFLGINSKISELHAALGLSNFPYIDEIIRQRKTIHDWYNSYLEGNLARPAIPPDFSYNYGYYPVLFSSEEQLMRVFQALGQANIHPRRYFYPSLNHLPYLNSYQPCPCSEDIASRIACLPLYPSLTAQQVERISTLILENL